MIKQNYHSVLLWTLAAICLYPILAYALMYQLGVFVNRLPHGKIWFLIQTYLSGPALLVIGLIFIFGGMHRSSKIKKIVGAILSMIGLLWLILIVNEVIKEAA